MGVRGLGFLEFRFLGLGVDPGLAAHVAAELKNEAGFRV